MTKRVFIVPAVIAALTVAGVLGAGFISVPTLTHAFDGDFSGEARRAVLTVEGVRCYGTADFLREHIEHVPGLVSMTAYAGRKRVVIEYSAGEVDLDEIIAAIEEPISVESERMEYFKVTSCRDE